MKRIVFDFNEKDFFSDTAPSITKPFEFNYHLFESLINDLKMLKQTYPDGYFAIKNPRTNVIEDCNIIITPEKTHVISQSLILIDEKNTIKASIKNPSPTFKTFAFTYDKEEKKLYVLDLRNEKKQMTIEKNGNKKIIDWKHGSEQSIKVTTYENQNHLSKTQNKLEVGGSGSLLIEKILFENDTMRITIKSSQVREVIIKNNSIESYSLNQSRIKKSIDSFNTLSGVSENSDVMFNKLLESKNLDSLNKKLSEIRDMNLLFEDNNKFNVLSEKEVLVEVENVINKTMDINKNDRKMFIELTTKLNDSFKTNEAEASDIKCNYLNNVFIEDSNVEIDLTCIDKNNLSVIEFLIKTTKIEMLENKSKMKI